jgi:hypothetical protein
MKSHLSEEQLSEWIAGQSGGEAEWHLRECPECAAEVERTRKALLLFRDSGYQCAEYWTEQPPIRRARKVGGWVPVAVAISAAMLTIVVTLHRSPVREPQPIVQTTQEVFLQIPYVVPPAPYERTEVVRMDVPVAALIAAGFRLDAPAADSISADVVVGQDGRPLAVGFPENKQ